MYNYKGEDYLELENVQMCWSISHYDGPMSGIALYNNEYYYVECHQHYDSRPRYFWLYKLNEDECVKELAQHDLFKKYYGHYCDFRNNKRIPFEELKSLDFQKPKHSLSFTNIDNIVGINRSPYLDRKSIGYFEL